MARLSACLIVMFDCRLDGLILACFVAAQTETVFSIVHG